MIENRLSWMIGGAQGSGVDSSANVFARGCTFGGLFVHGKREYYSNIMGKHSYFQVRVDSHRVRSDINTVNILATFDAETLVRHMDEVTPGGGILYDPNLIKTEIYDIANLDRRVKDDVAKRLKMEGFTTKVEDVLESARRRGVKLHPLPYMELLKNLAKQVGETQVSRLTRMINVMAVAGSFGLLDYDIELLKKSIAFAFKGRLKIIEANNYAAEATYNYVKDRYKDGFDYRLRAIPPTEPRVYLQGNQAIAIGKLMGGCRFQTYYPISPATDESVFLESKETFDIEERIENPQIEEKSLVDRKGSILVVQTEDEIAAITMASGASLTGVRAATSTSGPGFSLMVEAMGWASMNEVPVVITLYQRGGPSTGMPTRNEQGDLRFVMHAGHGESPRIVLASGDQQECFYDAVKAFNYAERYQLPVVHLVDKALANSSSTFPLFSMEGIAIDRGLFFNPEEVQESSSDTHGYRRFRFTESGISPRALLGDKGGIFWATGDEHDESGHITEDPVIRVKMMDKRMRKLEQANKEITSAEKLNFFGEKTAELTVVSWGSPKGAILDAIEKLDAEGHKLNYLQIRLLCPFPAKEVASILTKSKIIVDVEMNYSGQLTGLIMEHTGIRCDHRLVKYNGRPITMDEVYDGLKEILNGKGEPRMVLTHGS